MIILTMIILVILVIRMFENISKVMFNLSEHELDNCSASVFQDLHFQIIFDIKFTNSKAISIHRFQKSFQDFYASMQ